MKLLVTGGAGYIGSHFCQKAAQAGHEIVVYDNLSTGHKVFARYGPLVKNDLQNTTALEKTLKDEKVEAVVHFAASALVGESMQKPDFYYENNVIGTFSLLKAMKNVGVSKIIFSSSCATYGIHADPISETTPQSPVNPYGQTKKHCEEMLFNFKNTFDWQVGCLRYFNVIGQDPGNQHWEDHDPETHIVPNIMKAEIFGQSFKVNGNNHDTPDGTCIRDYIDVCDLADVHLKALEEIQTQPLLISNVGHGRGISVFEMIRSYEKVYSINLNIEEVAARPGDPPHLVANTDFLKTWYNSSFKTLEESLESLAQRRELLKA